MSYVPRTATTLIDLDLLLAVLNSKLIDWYFTIGSTNSKVNEYQFNILPFPTFRKEASPKEIAIAEELLPELEADPVTAYEQLSPLLNGAPFTPVLAEILIHLSRAIRKLEAVRGPVSRVERAKLSNQAQPLQDLVDNILFSMVGFSGAEAESLSRRLDDMA